MGHTTKTRKGQRGNAEPNSSIKNYLNHTSTVAVNQARRDTLSDYLWLAQQFLIAGAIWAGMAFATVALSPA